MTLATPYSPEDVPSREVTRALDFLKELTELRELLEMSIEQNTDGEGNTKNLRIRLLIDSYLSQSECSLNELGAFLRRLQAFEKTN